MKNGIDTQHRMNEYLQDLPSDCTPTAPPPAPLPLQSHKILKGIRD